MKSSLVLIGGGGHCLSCIDVVGQEGKFKIIGIIDQLKGPNDSVLGYPIIGMDEDLPRLREHYEYALITVGQIKSARPRIQIFNILSKLDFQLPMIISPKAYVSPHSKVGAGTIIMHGAIVNANSVVGRNCIINNKALIEHDALIGGHCHIATGSIVNGNVEVGNETFIGSGSVVREGTKIGPQSFIAAGTKVMKNLPPNSNYRNRL